MVSVVQNTAIDCADAYELAKFWSAVNGRPLHSDASLGACSTPHQTTHLAPAPLARRRWVGSGRGGRLAVQYTARIFDQNFMGSCGTNQLDEQSFDFAGKNAVRRMRIRGDQRHQAG